MLSYYRLATGGTFQLHILHLRQPDNTHKPVIIFLLFAYKHTLNPFTNISKQFVGNSTNTLS
jgi:hypothetical protein